MAPNRGTLGTLKLLWVLAALAYLVLAFTGAASGPTNDGPALWSWYMIAALTFPSGWIVAYIHLLTPMVQAATGYSFAAAYGWWIICTGLIFTAGYVQWFVLLPRLWRKWKEKGPDQRRAAIVRGALVLMWLVVAAIALASLFFSSDHRMVDNAAINDAVFAVSIYGFLAFSFPLGWIVGVPLILFVDDPSVMISAWLGATVGSYLQWFVLLPRLWRKWKTGRTGATHTGQ